MPPSAGTPTAPTLTAPPPFEYLGRRGPTRAWWRELSLATALGLTWCVRTVHVSLLLSRGDFKLHEEEAAEGGLSHLPTCLSASCSSDLAGMN